MTERVTIVSANGTTYRIPDMWLAGICQSSGCTVQAAIAFYIEMAELDARDGFVAVSAS